MEKGMTAEIKMLCFFPLPHKKMTASCFAAIFCCLILLHQATLEEFVRGRAVERQGRRPQEYEHISRASDEVFRQPGKRKNSRVTWGSNNSFYFGLSLVCRQKRNTGCISQMHFCHNCKRHF